MRAKRRRWAAPDRKVDNAALKDFYTNDYLPATTDEEGLGPQGVGRLGELVKVLQHLTRRAA